MKFRMSEKSLFAVLLRSPWWVSLLVAAGFAAVARALLPERFQTVGMLGSFPFVVIGAIAAWRQWKAPSAARVTETLEAVSTMPWKNFEALLRDAWTRDGYTVTAGSGGADLRLEKAGRTTMVSARRWKAGNHGAEPIRELAAAVRKADASGAIYVALAALNENTAALLKTEGVQLLQGEALAALIAGSMPTVQQKK
ncbi:restriction endonuclease [Variovorax sp. VNK109]|jgi:restriction system protein|uniref:restriction endonuclease n=1 Tax=Variovorax sp. VNK109 TaxID=3400919 RepID=UPI003C11C9FD